MADIAITLCDRNRDLVNAWKNEFTGIASVAIHNESFIHFPADAIVSPANSYGFMDGGFDRILSEHLGWHIQVALKQAIARLPAKELFVGQSLTVATSHYNWPYLISAPTMRVPMSLSDDSVNAYLAARAVFIELRDNPNINSIVMTGLGTGAGGLSPNICARQMRAAYDSVFVSDTYPISWQNALIAHQALYARDIA